MRAYGFSLVELMIVVAMVGIVAGIGTPVYMDALDGARVAKAIGDIAAIGTEIRLFFLENDRLPATLAEIGRADFPDPYGNAYEYLPIQGAGGGGAGGGGGGGGGVGGYRKDRMLVPINSDFDLYSMGKDGRSVPALTAAASWDDIIRANDGGYIGLASEF